MVFADDWETHDANWAKIREAIWAGSLGDDGKASARLDSRREGGVIMVYTREADDLNDVGRVLRRLRQVGFDGRLSYKANTTTGALVYGKGSACYVAPPRSIEFEDRRARVVEREQASGVRITGS